MSDVLTVELRTEYGKQPMKRLRNAGFVPANLYGHGETNVHLTCTLDEVRAMAKHGSRIVDLRGAVNEKAFVREVQWDAFGGRVIHLDLSRVSAGDRVKSQVALELKGDARGLKEGGVIEFLVHELEIEAPALALPEKIVLNVSDLGMGGEIRAAAVKLPEGVKLVTDSDVVLVHCVRPKDSTAALAPAAPGEPEVIGRKAAEEGDEEK